MRYFEWSNDSDRDHLSQNHFPNAYCDKCSCGVHAVNRRGQVSATCGCTNDFDMVNTGFPGVTAFIRPIYHAFRDHALWVFNPMKYIGEKTIAVIQSPDLAHLQETLPIYLIIRL
ncbi:unnamed protein product [Albugo candida]|uniref:Uncharacterized protein n=1 Tax=Albugo candida TaxID=65357 RepID=A0A024GVY0_9STRA|nr:unnamed protein product [Albugo candida]|eukprot:CCI50675.1 unnamed protein product [Albugo candida]